MLHRQFYQAQHRAFLVAVAQPLLPRQPSARYFLQRIPFAHTTCDSFRFPVDQPDAVINFKNKYRSVRLQAAGPLGVGMGFDDANDFEANIVIVKGGGAGSVLANDWLPRARLHAVRQKL